MAGVDFTEIYTNFLTRYLGDSQTVDITDPEWQIAIQHYNTAVRRWDNVDGVLWDELWTQLSAASDGVKTYTSGTYAYVAPTNMQSVGGTVTLGGTSTPRYQVPVIDSMDVQAMANQTPYAYWTGNPHSGFTLNLNLGSADTQFNGYTINYPYYMKPTYLTTSETGATVCQMRDPEFAINTLLSLRYQESRNFPAQQIADRDATQSLANMEVRNAMGSPYNTWKYEDLGAGWGDNPPQGFGF